MRLCWVLLAMASAAAALPSIGSELFKRNEIAPSLAWNRYLELQNSIEKLAAANRAARCKINVDAGAVADLVDLHKMGKRYVGPSRHLEDMLNPLSLGDGSSSWDDC